MEFNSIVYDAAKNGDIDALEAAILHHRHLIDTPNNKGWTPMHVAAKRGHAIIIETLVRLKSMSIDYPIKHNGWTSLYVAVQYAHIPVIETLIRLGSKAIDIPENTGWTPMHVAA